MDYENTPVIELDQRRFRRQPMINSTGAGTYELPGIYTLDYRKHTHRREIGAKQKVNKNWVSTVRCASTTYHHLVVEAIFTDKFRSSATSRSLLRGVFLFLPLSGCWLLLCLWLLGLRGNEVREQTLWNLRAYLIELLSEVGVFLAEMCDVVTKPVIKSTTLFPATICLIR